MRAGLMLACLCVDAVAAFAGPRAALAALDNEQFCTAMGEIARIGKADVGRWIDRNTRDDGIDVLCDIRTVNYKRFVRIGGSASDPGWAERKQDEWNGIACNSPVLREAVENGWIIASTITPASGQRVLVIATCRKK